MIASMQTGARGIKASIKDSRAARTQVLAVNPGNHAGVVV
jgi:hypothetical protein